MPLSNHFFQFASQFSILKHLQVSFEDSAVFITELFGNSFAVANDFVTCGGDSLTQSFQFILDRIARNEPAGDSKSLVIHNERFANDNARRNGDSL